MYHMRAFWGGVKITNITHMKELKRKKQLRFFLNVYLCLIFSIAYIQNDVWLTVKIIMFLVMTAVIRQCTMYCDLTIWHQLILFFFVWRKYENMSPCTGSTVITSYDQIVSCAGTQFGWWASESYQWWLSIAHKDTSWLMDPYIIQGPSMPPVMTKQSEWAFS